MVQGFNLVLISRSEEKLKKTIQDLRQLENAPATAQLTYVVSEASDLSADNFNAIEKQIKDKNLRILVNNVGVSKGTIPFVSQPEAFITDMLSVNCGFPVLITRKILPYMVADKGTSGKRAIINVSSMTAYIPCPNLAIYAATKAFNLNFSKSLSVELSDVNIDVVAITPGLTQSNLVPIKQTSWMVPSARESAREGLIKLNSYFFDLPAQFSHYLMLKAAIFSAAVCPSSLQKWIAQSYMSTIPARESEGKLKN